MPKSNKINVYTLGQLGVNRVKSPLHVEDGELLSAQNATIKPIQAQLALSKRDGMAKINSSAAAGTLLQIVNVPISPPENVCVTSISPATNDWKVGCWSSTLGLFVVLSQSGTGDRVITSPDGITWTSRTSAADVSWKDVIWVPDLTLFIAVGGPTLAAAQQVMTSPDGITWTSRTASSDRTWECVAWSPTLTLAAAIASDGVAAGQVMTSPDGVTWTARTSASARAWRSVVWADSLSLFVAVSETSGSTTQVMTSSNGTAWTLRDPGITSGWNDIAWSPELDLLVAVGAPYGGLGSTRAMYSTDGINWSAGTLASASSAIDKLAWGSGFNAFLHAGDVPSAAYTSDGSTWTDYTLGCSQLACYDVVYSSDLNKFLIIGEDSNGDADFELISTLT